MVDKQRIQNSITCYFVAMLCYCATFSMFFFLQIFRRGFLLKRNVKVKMERTYNKWCALEMQWSLFEGK